MPESEVPRARGRRERSLPPGYSTNGDGPWGHFVKDRDLQVGQQLTRADAAPGGGHAPAGQEDRGETEARHTGTKMPADRAVHRGDNRAKSPRPTPAVLVLARRADSEKRSPPARRAERPTSARIARRANRQTPRSRQR